MISLRAWKEEDAQALYEISQDPLLQHAWNPQYLYPTTIQDALNCIQGYLQANPKRFFIQAILYQQQVCGYIQCEVKDYGKAEVSYYVSSSYHNKGIMTSILPIFCASCFYHLPIAIIYARVAKDNLASQHVLIKNHFIEQKQNTIHLYYMRKCCNKNRK